MNTLKTTLRALREVRAADAHLRFSSAPANATKRCSLALISYINVRTGRARLRLVDRLGAIDLLLLAEIRFVFLRRLGVPGVTHLSAVVAEADVPNRRQVADENVRQRRAAAPGARTTPRPRQTDRPSRKAAARRCSPSASTSGLSKVRNEPLVACHPVIGSAPG